MSKKYIVVRNFYEGNGLHEIGNAFEHEDKKLIEKELADGNIQEVTEGSEVKDPAPAVTDESADEAPATGAPKEPTLPEPGTAADQPLPPAEPAQPQGPLTTPSPEQIAQDIQDSESTLTPSDNDLQIS